MKPRDDRVHRWDLDEAGARRVQERLAPLVETTDRLGAVKRLAGVDLAYDKHGDRLWAAVVVMDVDTLEVVEVQTTEGRVGMAYVPGLLSFREIPALIDCFSLLSAPVDLVFCDGQGRAHPRRFGLACHLGVLLDVPTIGCAKSRFVGTHRTPRPEKGCYARLMDRGEEIGQVLRTRTGVRPIWVSIGHRVSLNAARRWTLRVCREVRVPVPTREADLAVNRLRAERTGS